MRRVLVAVLAGALVFVLSAASAFAVSPLVEQYGGQAGGAQGDVAGGGGGLPFTGVDVVLLAGGGAVLVVAGMLVRRLARSR